VKDNPLIVGSEAYDIVMKIRARKGLKDVMPSADDYTDKL
jgi:hypothetical protein